MSPNDILQKIAENAFNDELEKIAMGGGTFAASNVKQVIGAVGTLAKKKKPRHFMNSVAQLFKTNRQWRPGIDYLQPSKIRMVGGPSTLVHAIS